MNELLSRLTPYPYNFGFFQRARGVCKSPCVALPPSPAQQNRPQPQTIDPSHANRFFALTESPPHPHYTRVYQNGWVTRDGSHVCKNNRLITELSLHYRQSLQNHPALTSRKLFRNVSYHKGNLLSLAGLGYYNYYHWMFEQLPKLALAKNEGSLKQAGWTLYAPTVHPAQLDALKHLTNLPILPSQQHPTVRANTIWGASPTSAVLEPSPWVVDWLNEMFSSLAQGIQSPAKIFLNRRNAKTRRIQNQDKLLSWALSNGFEEISLEGQSLAQQIAYFQNAREIIAPHGAGLTNLAFCRPDTLVLEFLGDNVHRPEKQTETCFWALANIIRARYGCLECKTVKNPTLEYDIVVAIPQLETLYKKLKA